MRAEPAQNGPSVTTQGLEERDTKVFCALTKLFLDITGACEQGRRKRGETTEERDRLLMGQWPGGSLRTTLSSSVILYCLFLR